MYSCFNIFYLVRNAMKFVFLDFLEREENVIKNGSLKKYAELYKLNVKKNIFMLKIPSQIVHTLAHLNINLCQYN